MATDFKKLIIIATLALFMVTETGCVGLLVTGIIIKKKRDRAAAAKALEEAVPEREAEALTVGIPVEVKEEVPAKDPIPPEKVSILTKPEIKPEPAAEKTSLRRAKTGVTYFSE